MAILNGMEFMWIAFIYIKVKKKINGVDNESLKL